jgi:cation diffusion facilitator family transporter
VTRGLTKYAGLSIATALLTIGLKAVAYWLTGSVGLLSDAMESGVNLIAALVALAALTIAAQPPDETHKYGHAKAEYFASGVEGTLILVAAVSIAYSAIDHLRRPKPIEQLGLGLFVSIIAAALNLVVARVLMRAGRQYRSITLVADAKHLMTDVWTTVGVIVGVAAVGVTGWKILDPIIALLVAVQIVVSGVKLLQSSALGLMDSALPNGEIQTIIEILERHTSSGVQYHALRTRQSGRLRFMSVHIQVPGAWTVQKGHSLLEEMDQDIRKALRPISVFTHLEPVEDPRSWDDIHIDREPD